MFSLTLSKHNSINPLDFKSLNDEVVTDSEFQIINSELEKYFVLKEAERAKLKGKTNPGSVIKKWNIKIRNEVRDELHKKILKRRVISPPKIALGFSFFYKK